MPRTICLGVALALGLGISSAAWAQSAATASAATPPGYPEPPAGYMYVAVVPVVPVVPVVTAVPQRYTPAPELPYITGQPIPNGYHVHEQPRRGLVVAGWTLTGVSYGISLITAISADFDNSTEYLVLPIAGPWLTLGRRDYANCPKNSDTSDGLDCAGDAFAAMGLIMDGILQAGGLTLLLTGYLAPKKQLIYYPSALSVRPRRMAGGYGLTMGGAF